MQVNGHELETKYVFYINMLKSHISEPKLLDFIWVKKYKKELRRRLEKLERDHDDKLVSDKAYTIWKKMINEVL